jgi:zinc D-Ala-D-Ala carboxypeptidase
MNEKYPYFSQKELESPDTNEHKMSKIFMTKLIALREDYNAPMVISSGYRTPDHNEKVSSTGRTGPHTSGKAVDVVVNRGEAHKLLTLALDHGFSGIGIKQNGEGRFLHLDNLEDYETLGPRPTIWSY